jgi:pyruvate kinase
MDIARFNFSHATNEQFLSIQELLNKFNQLHDTKVQTLIDLQGPRIRVGILPKEGIVLKDDEEITFSTDENATDTIYINDPYLHEDINVGEPLYLANGDIELVVTETNGSTIKARVIRGGRLTSRKAVNVPNTKLTTSGITDKDKTDIAFGIQHNADFIALSFVKNASDIEKMREIIGTTNAKVVAKIELKHAIENIDEIINSSDLIMVARGDLGIELPLEDIPLVQKDIIKRCNIANVPSIVATQMLMSMVNHYRPTRAEVSDVANALLDGTEAVMLSEETAFGKYPVEAVEYLVKIINKVEEFQQTTQ